MTTPKPVSKYVFTFAKDESGNEIKFRFMLSLGNMSKDIQAALNQGVGSLDGIDGIAIAGKYTLEITISRAFDPDEVITELKSRLDNILSDVLMPQQKPLILP